MASSVAALAWFVLVGAPSAVHAAEPATPTAATTPAAPPYASAAEAQAAADAAKADRAQAVVTYQEKVKACMHTFFATSCADKAREERNAAVEGADLTTQRAELFVRQEKARLNHEKLAAENQRRDARDAEKAAELRQNEAASKMAPPAAAPAAKTPSAAPPREPRGPRPEDDPAVRAANRATFERKQEEARVYAEKQARERQENEDKRARRRAQREADAAKLNNSGAATPVAPTPGKP